MFQMKLEFLLKITSFFAEHNISFEKILQLPVIKRETAEIVLVTHHASKKDYEDISKIKGFKIGQRN